jgi:subtilisin family serine protease
MKSIETVVIFILMLFVGTAIIASGNTQSDGENWAERYASKMTPRLEDALARLPEGGRLDVYAVMKDRISSEELGEIVRNIPLNDRHKVISDVLRSYSAESQARVRSVLNQWGSESAKESVRILWLSNTIRFTGTAGDIMSVRELPEIGYLGLVVDYPIETYQDVGPRKSTRDIIYYDGFESGAFGPEWVTWSDYAGRIQVTGSNGPIGSYHVTMDSEVDDSLSHCSMTLTIDLSTADSCFLTFMFKEFSDESDPGDVVSISEDGVTFYDVYSLSGSSSYEAKMIDLDEVAANNGIALTSDFRIRFAWEDNYPIPTDGFAFDEITIETGNPPPSPPTQNVVNLQAPLCWDIGVTGSRALILNIDSGVDYTHPDLANQIWNNPGEAPFGSNGIDDDGNGYIDDFNGWDFEYYDNDPYPSSSHGTNTAGIVCGDGTSGTATGMAPDATMAIARISGMADYWEAQQYAVLIGADAITSSYSYKWGIHDPDYHLFRTNCVNELLAGIIHANSIGNQGNDTSGFPIPFNISTPGNCPGPWIHPEQVEGGISSVLGCAGVYLDETLYTDSGQGPSAWEDMSIYDPSYLYSQNPDFWDYPYGGWSGGFPGLLKPDVCAYTSVTTTDLGGGYYSGFGGTSAATPHLGGAMCLLISSNPFASPRKISQALQETAEDKGPAGKDLRYGAGKIQVYDAVLRLVHNVEAFDTSPGIGDTVMVSISGIPGEEYGVVYSFYQGSTYIPGIGTLDLEPPFRMIFQGVIPVEGEVVESIIVPDRPSLAGQSLYVQGISDDTAGVTGQYLISLLETVTIQP